MDALFFPTLSLGAQAFLRTAYGVLLLLTLFEATPQGSRFFTTRKYGGYLDSTPLRDALFGPATWPFLLAIWMGCAVCLFLNIATPLAALVNAAFSYYFFINNRWTGIYRGMGAPGFMTWWLGAFTFLSEFALHHDPSGTLRPAVVLAFRVDFAVIMMCAGIYKATAGYRSSDGMELGMTNPWWGYFWWYFNKWPAHHPMFQLFNHLAYVVQISAGILMLIPHPWTRELGGLAIAVSFFGIALMIRLGFLCEMVILAALVHASEGSILDSVLVRCAPTQAPVVATVLVPHLAEGLRAAVLAYAVILPFAKAGLYTNFYGAKRLPGPLQTLLEKWTNLFGIIIWRVFTVDVTNFFADISVVDPATGEKRVYARPGKLDWFSRFRYLHVGEFVCLACIFTTLKYHTSDRAFFEGKLLCYARTVPCPAGWVVRFEHFVIKKIDGAFVSVPAARFDVDPASGKIVQESLDPSINLEVAAASHESARPGSYAPIR